LKKQPTKQISAVEQAQKDQQSKKMQDKVESTVKKALKELKKSKDIDVDLN
jgi:hypothetical protein